MDEYIVNEELAIKLKYGLINKFNGQITTILISFIKDYYTDYFDSLQKDSRCKITPDTYKDLFFKRVDEFKFVKDDDDTFDNKVTLVLPDMENFNFRDGLEGIETILEGISGRYVEITSEEYKLIYKKEVANINSFDDLKKVSIVKYNDTIYDAEDDILGYRLPMYMFSNSKPVKLFEALDTYVDNNLDKWLDEVIDTILEDVSNA